MFTASATGYCEEHGQVEYWHHTGATADEAWNNLNNAYDDILQVCSPEDFDIYQVKETA